MNDPTTQDETPAEDDADIDAALANPDPKKQVGGEGNHELWDDAPAA